MRARADDAKPLGLVLDTVDAGDELERLVSFGPVAGFEVLSASVREASASSPMPLLHEWIVGPVVVAHDGSFGVAELLDGHVAAAREGEAVAGELRADERPDERLGGLRRELERRLVGVDEKVASDGLEERRAQRLELLGGASEEMLRATGTPMRANICSCR